MNIRQLPIRVDSTCSTNQVGGLALNPERFIIENPMGASNSKAPIAALICAGAEPGRGKPGHSKIIVAARITATVSERMPRLERSGRLMLFT